jgi:hypothetical protein
MRENARHCSVFRTLRPAPGGIPPRRSRQIRVWVIPVTVSAVSFPLCHRHKRHRCAWSSPHRFSPFPARVDPSTDGISLLLSGFWAFVGVLGRETEHAMARSCGGAAWLSETKTCAILKSLYIAHESVSRPGGLYIAHELVSVSLLSGTAGRADRSPCRRCRRLINSRSFLPLRQMLFSPSFVQPIPTPLIKRLLVLEAARILNAPWFIFFCHHTSLRWCANAKLALAVAPVSGAILLHAVA